MSLRKAINEFCKMCVYDPKSGHGTWRQQTEGCTSPDCPLFPVRPKTTKPRAISAKSKGNEEKV